jgi:transposase
MDHTEPQLISTAELAPVPRSGPTPFSQQTVVWAKQAYLELTWEANSWRAQHARRVEREAALQGAVEALQSPIRDLTQRLAGAKSEKSACPARTGACTLAKPRKRGQQPGSTGHGRSARTALPGGTEGHDVSEAAQDGPACGKACAPFPGAASSDVIERQGQAPMRRLPRLRYPKTWQGPQAPGMVTAPPAPRVLPKSSLGVSVGTRVLRDQYLSGGPPHRFGKALQPHGVPLAAGTLTDGLPRSAGLCAPVRRALSARQMGAKRFHGEETRWEVCAEVAGNTGHRGSLWGTPAASVVFSRRAAWAWGRRAQRALCHAAQGPGGRGVRL